MKSLKETLPDTTALKSKLNAVLAGDLPDFLRSTRSRREEVIINRKYTLLSGGFALAIFVALFAASETYQGTWVFNILLGTSLIWLLVIILSGRQWLAKNQLLAREMNMALVSVFTNVLDRMMIYTHDSAHSVKTQALLDESALMTSRNLEIIADDIYTVYVEREVSIRELVATQIVKNPNGKSDTRIQLFKGVFVVAELAEEHSGETYISTDGDRSGFAHRTFWSDLVESGEVKETVLEWNDFENALHVAATDPVAAREILTPDFMQDVYSWWQEHKLNMRIAFKGKKLYILLPEETIRIATSTTSTKHKAIESYAWSLLRPIWRSLMLVEDVTH